MKYLQFTVAETTGRTFSIPMDKLEEIIKTLKDGDEFLQDEEVDTTDAYEVASFLNRNGLLDEIYNYEKDLYNESVKKCNKKYENHKNKER